MRGIGSLALVNSLQQKLIFKLKTYRCACEIKPETAYITAFFFRKEIWYFWGTNNLKTRLHCITMAKRTSRIAEEKKNSRREKRHQQNRIENDEKVENFGSDGE